MRCSSSHAITPMCANPSAEPPSSAKPILGRSPSAEVPRSAGCCAKQGATKTSKAIALDGSFISERPSQRTAYAEFIFLRLQGRAAVKVIPERQVRMKVADKLYRECGICHGTDAPGIGKAGK